MTDYRDLLIQLLLEKKETQAKCATLESKYIGEVCMVRTVSAGVFYGKLVAKVGAEVRIENARRVWYWEGAASLSELATAGTSTPNKCKFPVTVSSVELTGAIEIIPLTVCAEQILNGVPVWTKQ